MPRPGRGGTLDAIARGLASGMSRREALRAGGTALVGAAMMAPADAWATITGSCPSGRVKCNTKCCPHGEVCLGTGTRRHCGCPHHQTRCGTRCVNTQTAFGNCGRCGHRCATGQTCSAGHCHCPTGEVVCSGACVNLAHNHQHCGSCAHACAAGAAVRVREVRHPLRGGRGRRAPSGPAALATCAIRARTSALPSPPASAPPARRPAARGPCATTCTRSSRPAGCRPERPATSTTTAASRTTAPPASARPRR